MMLRLGADVTSPGHGALPRDLAASQRRLAGLVTPRAAHRAERAALDNPTGAATATALCWMPHTIKRPISPKNLTRDINRALRGRQSISLG